MPEELIPGGTPAETAVVESVVVVPDKPVKDRVQCEYCECQLAPDGGVMKMSARAKELRDLEEGIHAERKRWKAREAELEATIKAQTDELDAARATLMRPRKGFLDADL